MKGIKNTQGVKPQFYPQMTVPQWLQLTMPVRLRMKEIFEIPRSTGTEIHNNVVFSDGHTHKDLANITIEKMQDFVGSSSEDFYELLNATTKKVMKEHQDMLDEQVNKQFAIMQEIGKDKYEALTEVAKEIQGYVETLGVTFQSANDIEQIKEHFIEQEKKKQAKKKKRGRPFKKKTLSLSKEEPTTI